MTFKTFRKMGINPDNLDHGDYVQCPLCEGDIVVSSENCEYTDPSGNYITGHYKFMRGECNKCPLIVEECVDIDIEPDCEYYDPEK